MRRLTTLIAVLAIVALACGWADGGGSGDEEPEEQDAVQESSIDRPTLNLRHEFVESRFIGIELIPPRRP